MNLLIVNDEVLTADTMKMNMEWSEYGISQVFVAYDAKDARSCIKENQIDIILCDIEMPEENGISLCRWVRENRKDIECIFLTCHANFEYAREAIGLGCKNYLLLPTKYEEIGREIKKVAVQLTEQRKAQEYQEYGKQSLNEKVNLAAEKCRGKKPSEEIVEPMLKYIADNLGSPDLSVNEIAEKLCIHPIYLNRIFKKKKEVSIGKYITGERMKLAAELLKSGRFLASSVAEQVGYVSYPNFSMMFKKYYGCTPSRFQGVEDKKED